MEECQIVFNALSVFWENTSFIVEGILNDKAIAVFHKEGISKRRVTNWMSPEQFMKEIRDLDSFLRLGILRDFYVTHPKTGRFNERPGYIAEFARPQRSSTSPRGARKKPKW